MIRYLLFLLALPSLAQVHVEACGPSDSGFTGGTCYTSPVALPAGAPAYLQKERYGTFSYHFAVPDGAYSVTLYMIENSTAVTAAGQRIFSVMANGTPMTSALDIFASVGYNFPVVVSTSPISAVGGSGISIAFTSLVRNAVVSAIDIAPTTGETCAHLTTKAPIGALMVYRNGVLQREPADYTVAGMLVSPKSWGDGDSWTAYGSWREDWQCKGSQGVALLVLYVDPPVVVVGPPSTSGSPSEWHARTSSGREYFLVEWPPK